MCHNSKSYWSRYFKQVDLNYKIIKGEKLGIISMWHLYLSNSSSLISLLLIVIYCSEHIGVLFNVSIPFFNCFTTYIFILFLSVKSVKVNVSLPSWSDSLYAGHKSKKNHIGWEGERAIIISMSCDTWAQNVISVQRPRWCILLPVSSDFDNTDFTYLLSFCPPAYLLTTHIRGKRCQHWHQICHILCFLYKKHFLFCPWEYILIRVE